MDQQQLEVMNAILVAVGLSAACGFRVFVPLLGVSVAAHFGHLQLSPEFSWLGSLTVLFSLALATLLEVGAYSIPFIDHLMDSLSTPAAIVAGTLLTASLIGDVSPFLKWSLAVIAGGGAAGIVQFGSVVLRAGSTALTGGVGNILIAIMELAGALAMTLAALLFPLLAVAGFLAMVFLLIHALAVRKSGSRRPESPGN